MENYMVMRVILQGLGIVLNLSVVENGNLVTTERLIKPRNPIRNLRNLRKIKNPHVNARQIRSESPDEHIDANKNVLMDDVLRKVGVRPCDCSPPASAPPLDRLDCPDLSRPFY